MLIKCPECGKDVSDKAPACIHCGFPLEITNTNMCNINGKIYDLTEFLKYVKLNDSAWAFRIAMDTCGISFDDTKRLYKEVQSTGEIPSEFVATGRSVLVDVHSLRCPKCGSTAITTGARGISGFWGAIGASKTVNRCGKCGNTWEPRR